MLIQASSYFMKTIHFYLRVLKPEIRCRAVFISNVQISSHGISYILGNRFKFPRTLQIMTHEDSQLFTLNISALRSLPTQIFIFV
jgi:hypothetical protein